jgi:kumamolisin
VEPELTGRSPLQILACAACFVVSPAAAAAATGPALVHAQHLGGVAPATPVQAVIALRPRNAGLLRRLALRSSGRPGLDEATIRQLFAPEPATVRRVRAYLRSTGLRVTSHTDMTLTVAGPAMSAQRAFGVALDRYRAASGRTFHVPAGALRLPGGVAGAVQAVGGLDTGVRLRPSVELGSAASVTPSCSEVTAAQHSVGGYLPGDLGGPRAYGHDALIAAGDDGSGITIGMVEFSGYARRDVHRFRSCFPRITGAYQADARVGGRNLDTSGRAEVALDLEIAMAAAPDADLRAYIAPNDPAFMPAVIDRMRQDGVDIISDSWGACEPLISPRLLAAENTSLELAAVAGMSTFVATGDFGSTDCFPFTGSTGFVVDDPSSQPFATAVGGTALEQPPVFARHHERAWHGSGGGISTRWAKPAYQVGKTVNVRGRKCRSGAAQCRETPDVSLDARPKRSGYLVYCDRCGQAGSSPWAPVGGTSASAPLMAALVADADEAAGKKLGFANPFLYAHAGTGVFRDIVAGTNNMFGGNRYTARAGYDMATGLGSVRAGALATALAAWTPSPVSVDPTRLRVEGPVDGRRVAYGRKVIFRGTLTDRATGRPVVNAAVLVVTNLGTFRDRTNGAGVWSVRRSKAITRNLAWHAVYIGSDRAEPASSRTRALLVLPHLGLSVALPFERGRYIARAGVPFAASGVSRPAMLRAQVELQARRGSGPWRTIGADKVRRGGHYEAAGPLLATGQSVALRFVYGGGPSHRWLPARSRTLIVVAR